MIKRTHSNVGAYVFFAVALAVIVGGGFYLFINKNRAQITPPTNEELLAMAKNKVGAESAKLNDLQNKYIAEQDVIKKIADEYSRIQDTILRRTDVFFDDPNSDNPKLAMKVGNKSLEKDILAKRLEITKLLAAWKRKYEMMNSDLTPPELLPNIPDLVKTAQKDTYFVQKYMNELDDLINGLTTGNSDLSQGQINSYSNIVELNLNQVEESVAAMQAIQAIADAIYQPPVATTTLAVAPPPSSPPPPAPPVVTPSDIQAQQDALAQAENELKELEEQIAGTIPPDEANIQPVFYIDQGITTYTTILQDGLIWPDLAPVSNSDRPLLIEGSNKH